MEKAKATARFGSNAAKLATSVGKLKPLPELA